MDLQQDIYDGPKFERLEEYTVPDLLWVEVAVGWAAGATSAS